MRRSWALAWAVGLLCALLRGAVAADAAVGGVARQRGAPPAPPSLPYLSGVNGGSGGGGGGGIVRIVTGARTAAAASATSPRRPWQMRAPPNVALALHVTDVSAPWTPPTDSSGRFLQHSLPQIAGLPSPFVVSRCTSGPAGVSSDSTAWLRHARTTEDLLRMGNESLYWPFVYALECAVAMAPPSTAAVLKRAELLRRVGDLDAVLATLRYARRLSPKSPAVKMALVEQLGDALAVWEKDHKGQDRPEDRLQMTRLYVELVRQNCTEPEQCFELAAARVRMDLRQSAIECLQKAVAMAPHNAGYAAELWSQTLETTTGQLRRLRRKFSQRSRNFDLWTRASKRLRVTPVEEWLAGYRGALPAAAYTTTALLGPGYSVEQQLLYPHRRRSDGQARDSGGGGGGRSGEGGGGGEAEGVAAAGDSGGDDTPHLSPWYRGSALHQIVARAERRFTEAKRALEARLRPEQPEVCQRIHRLCAEGPTRLLYSLASPKTAGVNRGLGRDMTGRSTVDFATLTAASLNVSGTPYGTAWEDKPWPMFPLYMVNMLRSICGCADLDCDLAGRVWLMDVDAIRSAVRNASTSVAAHADGIGRGASVGARGGDGDAEENNNSSRGGGGVSDSGGGGSGGGGSGGGGAGREAAAAASAAQRLVAAVNPRDTLGYTPAALAVINNDALAFAALLESGAVDFAAEDAWGHSLVQLLYMVTPTAEVVAMHAAASAFLQAHRLPATPNFVDGGGGDGGDSRDAARKPLPPLLVGVARQLPKVPGLDVAEGWDPTTRTLPWAPISTWEGSAVVDDVDAREVSMAEIVDKYVSVGRPVVIKGAMSDCLRELAQWGRDGLKRSQLADVAYKAYSGEVGQHTTLAGFVDDFMSTGVLTNESQPRYILAQKGAKVMKTKYQHLDTVDFLSDTLKCIPYELQEYLNLPPPELPGAWAQYTLSMGGAGAGASFHMHEAALNVVVHGTRRWYVYPPTHSTYTNMPMFHWVRDVFPTLPPALRPIEFVQESGDIVLLPSWWAHGTVSVGDTLGFFKVVTNKLADTKNPIGPLREITATAVGWADKSVLSAPLATGGGGGG